MAPRSAEERAEISAAETAGRQVLIAIEAWPAFVPACVAPLRAEKGSDASAVLLLQCPTKVASTLAMVCYNNSKAASTAERFKPLLPRLSFVARDALRVQMTGADWANQDEIGELLAAAQADESRRSSSTPLPAERKQLVVVAVELSGGQVQAYGCLLRGMDGPDAERGPWQYCLDSGRQWSHSQPTGFTWTGSLRPGRVSTKRIAPPLLPFKNVPDYASSPTGDPQFESRHEFQISAPCLNAKEAAKVRAVSRLGREILDAAHRVVRPGVTTDEIDRVVHDATIEAGAYPAPLNYRTFPKSVCTSVNEVVCHGIPDDRELLDGDIVNVDVTAILDGYYGDMNETFVVGNNVAQETKDLVKCSHDSLMKAIEECKPGARYRDLGDIISAHVKKCGFQVDRTYCGHGIGETFHQAPSIPHYAGNKAKGVMKAGHCFTIEPMINMGSWRDKLWPDGWTAVTTDGKPSAQFEHMLLITETGVEVLSARLPSSPPLWWEV